MCLPNTGAFDSAQGPANLVLRQPLFKEMKELLEDNSFTMIDFAAEDIYKIDASGEWF